ncbi:MAG: choice-of-anchor J domain-containing protein [Lysobacteraceae bacterium]
MVVATAFALALGAAGVQASDAHMAARGGTVVGGETGNAAPSKPFSLAGVPALLAEDFTGAGVTFPPAGWIRRNQSSVIGTNTNCWNGFDASFTGWPAHSGTEQAGVNFNCVAGAGTISGWLITSQVTGLNNGDQISFWTRSTGSGFADRLEVRLCTDSTPDSCGAAGSTGSSATDVGNFSTLLLSVNPDLDSFGYPDVYTEFTHTVSGLAGPVSGRIAFRYFVEDGGPSGTASDLMTIDDVLITGAAGPSLSLGTVTDLDACASNPGNNNGIIEPGEVVNLTIPLAAANGDYNNVVGTLSSTTPGVTILTGVGSYGVIAGGSSVSANYSIGVDGGVACGSAIDLSLAVSSDEDNFTFPLASRTVGNAGGPLSFPVAVGTPIPDNNVGGLDSTATVSGVSGPITNVSARVTATHTWVGDVRIQLTSPGGTTITLLDRPGVPTSTFGCAADNIDILFADGQPDPESLCNTGVWTVTDASPVPGDAFADFSGEDANGTWTLNINDNGAGDTGSLVSWELFVEPGAPGVCNVCLSDPDIQINVGSVNFGTVTFGSAAPVQLITISNAGDGPGTVGAPVFSGPFAQSGGTCPAAPFMLNPGDSCTIGIAFSGTTVGSYSGTVTIDGAGTPIVVNLAAAIAAAPPVFIPVSSPWMLGLMFALMGLVAGVVVVRRRG